MTSIVTFPTGTYTLPATDTNGNLQISSFNSGTSASSSTFWRGDGTWAAPTSSAWATGIAAVPSVSATTSSNPSQTNGWNVVPLDSTNFDVGSFYNTSTYKYLPTLSGIYQVNFCIYFSSGMSSGTLYAVGVYKNGSLYKIVAEANNFSPVIMSGSCLVNLNGSTDYIQPFFYNGGSGSIVLTGGNSYFDIIYVGPSS